MKKTFICTFWLVTIGCSALLVWNTLPYFNFQPTHIFLMEKFIQWQEPLWYVCFYLHIAAGVVCLLSALFSLSSRILRYWPRLHRISGRSYGFSVCLLLVPTGLYMALFAKGGIPGILGFLLNGVLLFIPTVIGIRSVLRGDLKAHRRWMIYSYAMAATAISFRLLFIAFDFVNVPHAYASAIWGSLFVNGIIAYRLLHPRITSTRPRKGSLHRAEPLAPRDSTAVS